MGRRPFKDRLRAEFATLGKALTSAHRLELLDLLAQGERSVDELAHELDQALANASAHLQVLRQTRLVEADKRGLHVVSRLAAPEVVTFWRTLRDLATARLADIDRLVETYLTDRAALTAVELTELWRLVEDATVTLLDMRPAHEYRQGPSQRSLHPGGRARTPPRGAAARPRGRGLLPRAYRV